MITLGIIGVVAAMSIPSLINSVQDMEYKTTYRKAYSVASQALANAVGNNELVDLPNASNQTERMINFAAFRSKFKTVKTCGDPTTAPYVANIFACWATGETWYGASPDPNSGVAFIDSSGMSWALLNAFAGIQTNSLIVDTNGLKLPNKLGQDRFILPIRASNGTGSGTLTKIVSFGNCVSTISCSGYAYTDVCPSVASHPCYYTNWLLN